MIKRGQPAAYRQLAALPWRDTAVQHTTSSTGHGRRESRSLKTCSIADDLGRIAFPQARLALRVHRRRKQTGRRASRETVYAA
ncbi:ISAs1 family transposase, partial [Streptomyces minutiscleroticus]